MRSYQQKRGSGIQRGDGLAFNLYKAALNKYGVDTSDLMEGEFHAPMKNNGKWKTGNFVGPRTQLMTRIKRGDKPLNEVDMISMAHDLRYSLGVRPDDIANADKKMLYSLAKSKESLYNRIPAGIAIGAKYAFEKTIGKTLYPTLKSLNNKKLNSSDDNTIYENKLRELEQKGYGIDPSAFLKLKLSQTSRLPTFENKIQPADGSESVSATDYTQPEVEGDSNIDSEMNGSGIRLSGGLLPLLLVPFAGLITKMAVGAAVGVASGSASLGVWGIGEHHRPENVARRIERRVERRIQKGKGTADIMSKIKNMKVKLTDFSKSALDKISAFIKEHGTAENAVEIAEFLRPFVWEVVKIKLRAMGMPANMQGSGASTEEDAKLVLENVDFSKVQKAIEQEGDGLRLAGPKMSGSGRVSARKVIDELVRDPDLIQDRAYIKSLLLKAPTRQANIIIAFLRSNGHDY